MFHKLKKKYMAISWKKITIFQSCDHQLKLNAVATGMNKIFSWCLLKNNGFDKFQNKYSFIFELHN